MDEMKLIVMCHDKVILLSVPTKHSLLGIYVKIRLYTVYCIPVYLIISSQICTVS